MRPGCCQVKISDNMDLTIIASVLIICGSIAALILKIINARKMTVITKEEWGDVMEKLKILQETTDKHEVWLTEIRATWIIEWKFLKEMLTEIKENITTLEKSMDELKKCVWSSRREGK